MTEDIRCARCGHGFRTHAPGGPCAGCRHEHPGGMVCLAGKICDCPGFLWVTPDGPAVGSYREPPQR